MNHGEGYRLFPEDDGTVRFRITATRGTHVKGELCGSPDHFDRLRTAFTDEEWRVGTAEVIQKHGEWRLHVTVTHETHHVASKHDADTIVGVDVNEDCISLAAMGRSGSMKDSVVIEYPSVKEQRHEFFTKRKRMQTAGQTAYEAVVATDTVVREYFHDHVTDIGLSGRETSNLCRHGGKESRLRNADEPPITLTAVRCTPRDGVVQSCVGGDAV